MRIIFEPRVYLVGRQVVNEQDLDNFLSDHGVDGWETDTEVGADKLCEIGGRTCYMSFAKPRPGGNAAYIRHIKEVGHGSVLEHGVWNLIFSDVSRTLTHELVRHRAGWGYSQLSQRYVDESVAEYVVPKELQTEVRAAMDVLQLSNLMPLTVDGVSEAIDRGCSVASMAGLIWLRSCLTANHDYRHLSDYLFKKLGDSHILLANMTIQNVGEVVTLSQEEKTVIRKGARQAARSVLPNATETKIFVTANARALRHFIEMRGAAPAEPEIRHLTFKVWQALMKDHSTLFGDYIWTFGKDGLPADVTTPYRKV